MFGGKMEQLPDDSFIDALTLASEWGNRIDDLAWLGAGMAFLAVFGRENGFTTLDRDCTSAIDVLYSMADFAGIGRLDFEDRLAEQWDKIAERAVRPLDMPTASD
jgi:hypothetical protein